MVYTGRTHWLKLITCLSWSLLLIFHAAGQPGSPLLHNSRAARLPSPADGPVTVYVDKAGFNPRYFGLMKDTALTTHKAVFRKDGMQGKDSALPDPGYITVELGPLADGTYEFSSYAILTGKALKTYRMQWQWGTDRITSRIVYDNYGGYQYIGKFDLTKEKRSLKIWLPAGVALGYISYKRYEAPKLPDGLTAQYVPKVTPPLSHPRLWVTPAFLPTLKERLQAPENSAAWNKVRQIAQAPYAFNPDPTKEIFYNEALESAIRTKAFYYLANHDTRVGQEAVKLLSDYLGVLEFGNVTYGDITREIGRAIYTSALVYDWCYDLLDATQKACLHQHMLRLSRDMEIGWPPFVDPIVNGHANEAQVSRDLLAMSIAIYNEDTLPYRYTSYALLEQLVPMRAFEYQSPRHNQGIDYGAYRFGWEIHGAMLFYRMLGEKLYPDNLKNLPYYWLYMRLPDGYMLRDGDMFSNKKGNGANSYWKQPQTMLLCYSYLKDPLLKGEFDREGGLPDDPVLFLLLNDPAIKAIPQPTQLPLTKDFGHILGSMVARTGWNNTPESNDVVAEIKGGGYAFGNHQHPDAGAIQLYYHGMQFGDIGLYLSYGSPYDYNVNKRSIAHSMMLAYDPNEKLYYRARTNDGGARFSQRFPVSPQQVQSDPWFNVGAVLSCDAGPDPRIPLYSYFKADLTPAYSGKLSSYTRSLCFLHLNNPTVPAVMIVADDMETATPDITKYWQVNAYNPPTTVGSEIFLQSKAAGITGYTAIDMLLPAPQDRETRIWGGDSSRNIFGTYYPVDPSKPESKAYRIMISPREKARHNRFLTLFQMTTDTAQRLPVYFKEHADHYEVRIADVVQVLSAGKDPITDSITLDIPGSQTGYTLVATGLDNGFWHLQGTTTQQGPAIQRGPATNINFYVRPGKNTLQMHLTEGRYRLIPGRSADGSYTEEPNGLPYILK
jgi:heparin/heparan-sulfate lyase